MRTCKDCGKDISDRHKNAIRCHDCQEEANRRKARFLKKSKKCMNCGKEIDRSRRKFCSEKCANEFYNKNRKNKNKYNICIVCTNTFITNNPCQIYCSHECRSIGSRARNYYTRKEKKEKNRNDRNNRFDDVFPEMPEKLKNKLYEEFWVQGENGLLELIEIGKDIKFRKSKRMVHE